MIRALSVTVVLAFSGFAQAQTLQEQALMEWDAAEYQKIQALASYEDLPFIRNNALGYSDVPERYWDNWAYLDGISLIADLGGADVWFSERVAQYEANMEIGANDEQAGDWEYQLAEAVFETATLYYQAGQYAEAKAKFSEAYEHYAWAQFSWTIAKHPFSTAYDLGFVLNSELTSFGC